MSLVYSTETGRICPNCGLAVAQCLCKRRAAGQLPGDGAGAGQVRVSRESKGRGGKTVTLVRGLPLAAQTLAQLGKQLRAACGTGGTAKDGVLELQGDHVEKTLAWLQQRGHAAKRSGG